MPQRSQSRRWLAAALASPWLLLAATLSAQADKPSAIFRFDELGLSIDLGALGALKPDLRANDWTPGHWRGEVAGHSVEVWLMKYSRKTYSIEEPADVLGTYVYNQLEDAPERSRWLFRDRRLLAGPFGFVPYAIRASCPVAATAGARRQGRCHLLCGVVRDHGYALAVECLPLADSKSKLEPVQSRILQVMEKGVRYEGPIRDAAWTDAEARAYWQKYAAAKIHDQLRLKRTKHYIILSNAGSDLFAKKMEECYSKIRKAFPFDEVKGRRRLPVLLFRTDEQYFDFYCRRARIKREEAMESKGHAWLDYYATWYEAPNDPTHVHEATHQLFTNRLLLDGGGSWFHEGVADFMAENHNEVRAAARLMIKSGEYVPFKKFMLIPDLASARIGGGKRLGDAATANYQQAASIIMFLHDSRFGRKRFQDFVHMIGRVNDRDLKGMEQALQEIYGVDIDGFEQRWKVHYR